MIITVDVHPAANAGNTVKLNGSANPVSFGYAVTPTVFNNQSDLGGTQTISSILPLTLVSFTGDRRNADEVQLHWITAGEVSTGSFAVEWSGNGSHYSPIAFLPAAGISSGQRNYRFLHRFPAEGNNYYRLKMIDKDGRFTYSRVVSMNIAVAPFKIMACPNPVTDLLQLRVRAVKNETILFYLYDANCKMIASKSISVLKGDFQFNWLLVSLVPGNYFIKSSNNSLETIKIIKN
ncbi:MAG: T9SS type A sorting domain-containing protein [Chitinophagaceae bacterium]|nr:T9SS type A sorting domain-containing protein [Chitinophagaceae bacterium]